MTRSYLALRIRVARRNLLSLQLSKAPTIAVLLASEALRLAVEDYHRATSIDPIAVAAHAYASATGKQA